MTAHTITLDVDLRPSTATADTQYRWQCSCREHGEYTRNVRSARNGGQRHVAAMERGHDPFARLKMPGAGGARTTEGNERAHARSERRAAIARAVMRGGR